LNKAKEFHLARSISSIEGQPLLEVKLAPSIKVAACPKKPAATMHQEKSEKDQDWLGMGRGR